MARLNGILSKLKGSVGSLTFKQNSGLTVVSEKITKQSNARTESQQKQRMISLSYLLVYSSSACPLLLEPVLPNAARNAPSSVLLQDLQHDLQHIFASQQS